MKIQNIFILATLVSLNVHALELSLEKNLRESGEAIKFSLQGKNQEQKDAWIRANVTVIEAQKWNEFQKRLIEMTSGEKVFQILEDIQATQVSPLVTSTQKKSESPKQLSSNPPSIESTKLLSEKAPDEEIELGIVQLEKCVTTKKKSRWNNFKSILTKLGKSKKKNINDHIDDQFNQYIDSVKRERLANKVLTKRKKSFNDTDIAFKNLGDSFRDFFRNASNITINGEKYIANKADNHDETGSNAYKFIMAKILKHFELPQKLKDLLIGESQVDQAKATNMAEIVKRYFNDENKKNEINKQELVRFTKTVNLFLQTVDQIPSKSLGFLSMSKSAGNEFGVMTPTPNTTVDGKKYSRDLEIKVNLAKNKLNYDMSVSMPFTYDITKGAKSDRYTYAEYKTGLKMEFNYSNDDMVLNPKNTGVILGKLDKSKLNKKAFKKFLGQMKKRNKQKDQSDYFKFNDTLFSKMVEAVKNQ